MNNSENKEYLSEEEYQKANKKVNRVATILIIVGLIVAISSIVWMVIGLNVLHSKFAGIGGPVLILGLATLAFGGQLKFVSHGRQINAYLAQQQMPVVKEVAEKMSPTAGKVAKEVAKGIKEGINEADNEK